MSLIRIARASRNAKILLDEAKKQKAKAKSNSVIGNIPTDVNPAKPGAKEADAPEQGLEIAPVVLSNPNVSAEESISVHVPHTHNDAAAETTHLATTIHPLAKEHGGTPHPTLPHEITFHGSKAKEATSFVKKLPKNIRQDTTLSHSGDESIEDGEGQPLFEDFTHADAHKAKISTVKDHATLKRVHAHLAKAAKLPGLSAEKKAHYGALKTHLVTHAASQGLTIETSGGNSDLPAPESAEDVINQGGMGEPPAGPASHDESEEESIVSRMTRIAAGKTLLDEAKDRLSAAGIEIGAETAAFALIEDVIDELASNGEHVVHVNYKVHDSSQAHHTVHHLLNHAMKNGAHKFDADGYNGHIKLHFKSAHQAKKFHATAADAQHVHRTEVHHIDAHECVLTASAEQTINEDGQGPNLIGPAGSCIVRLNTTMGVAHMPLDKMLAKFGGQSNPGGGYKFPVETAQSFLNWYMKNGGKGYIDTGDGKKHGPNENISEVVVGPHGLPCKGEITKLIGTSYWHEDDTVGHEENMNAKALSDKLNSAKTSLSKHGIDATLKGSGNFQVLKLKPKLDAPHTIINLAKRESIDEANMRANVGHVSLRHNGLFTKNANGNWVRMSNKARLHLLAMQKAKAHKDSAKDEKDDKKKKEHEDKAEAHKKEGKDTFHELDKDEQDKMVAHHAVDHDDDSDDKSKKG